MKFGPILTPVHQGQQQLVRSAQFGRSAEVSQTFFDHGQHLFKGLSLDARQPFEVRVF
jgi:hypothetical protein